MHRGSGLQQSPFTVSHQPGARSPGGKGDSGPATRLPTSGAHRRVPPRLLPPLAVADLDRHGEGEEVQPAPGGWGSLPLVCLHADCPVLGLGQQGHWPSPGHCHRGRHASPECEGWGQGWPLDPVQSRVWGSGLVGCGHGAVGNSGDLLEEKHSWMQGGRGNSVLLCPSWPQQPAHSNHVIHTAVTFALTQDFRLPPSSPPGLSGIPRDCLISKSGSSVPLANFLCANFLSHLPHCPPRVCGK